MMKDAPLFILAALLNVLLFQLYTPHPHWKQYHMLQGKKIMFCQWYFVQVYNGLHNGVLRFISFDFT